MHESESARTSQRRAAAQTMQHIPVTGSVFPALNNRRPTYTFRMSFVLHHINLNSILLCFMKSKNFSSSSCSAKGSDCCWLKDKVGLSWLFSPKVKCGHRLSCEGGCLHSVTAKNVFSSVPICNQARYSRRCMGAGCGVRACGGQGWGPVGAAAQHRAAGRSWVDTLFGNLWFWRMAGAL